jgi:parallel beta-helix repeat protein
MPGSESVVVSSGSHITLLDPARQRAGATNAQELTADSDSSIAIGESFEMGEEVADVLPMSLNGDALSDFVVLDSKGLSMVASQSASVFSVTNTNDGGPGSLRAAILSANSNAGLDTISFNIPAAGVHTISPTSPLPKITDPVTIDGTTQPGFAGTPLIELEGGQAGESNGLFLTAGKCTIRGLAINRFFELGGNPYAGFQIWIDITSGHNRIEGNLINTNPQGTDAAPNPQDLFRSGIFVENSADNIIGGTAASARNVISGNKQYGIYLNGSGTARTIVQGNYIGVDITGTKAIKNGFLGIYIGGTENLIGGVVAGARNVIANNSPYGIRLDSDADDGNRIQGNYIGTDATGTVAMPNFLSGILLGAVRYTTVGGTAPLARNVISGHSQYGIDINASGCDGFVVQGNYIGTDATGTVAIPNRTAGINLGNTTDSVFSGNVISGNTGYGIHLYGASVSASTGTEIRNNLVGTDATGSAALGNSEVGIYIDGTGGASVVGNTIAFNRKGGVFVGLAWNDALRQNSIYANGGLGIDLAKSGCNYLLGCFGTVVANDACDADKGGNLLQNYPVISGAAAADSGTVIAGTLNSAANTRFAIDFFSNSVCNASGNGEGKVFIGSISVTTDASCNVSFSTLVPARLSNGDIVTATATDPNGNTSEFSQCATVSGSISVPGPSPTPSPTPTGTVATFQFQHSFEDIEEGAGAIRVTVVRTGSLTGTAFVDYATADGTAIQRKDYIPATGTLRFDEGESRKNFLVLIVDDSYQSTGGGKSLKLSLSNPRGTVDSAVLGTPATINLNIFENDSGPKPNPIEGEWFFVQQQYFDFLNRQPDDDGLAFWIGQVTSCNSDSACTEVKRINVSAAFFISIEFQQTGYLVERMYKTAYGDANGTSNLGGSHQLTVPIIRFTQFLQDTQHIGQGVVVLAPGWQQALENNKQTYALEFVQTSRFLTAFPTSMMPAQFVDKLNQDAGSVLSSSERQNAIDLFAGAGDSSNTIARAQALRIVAEDPDLIAAEKNRAFVLAQYFGYLRRNPNDLADTDYTGYEFWLTKLNQFNGDYIAAEMVKAFISSGEYRQRFGP